MKKVLSFLFLFVLVSGADQKKVAIKKDVAHKGAAAKKAVTVKGPAKKHAPVLASVRARKKAPIGVSRKKKKVYKTPKAHVQAAGKKKAIHKAIKHAATTKKIKKVAVSLEKQLQAIPFADRQKFLKNLEEVAAHAHPLQRKKFEEFLKHSPTVKKYHEETKAKQEKILKDVAAQAEAALKTKSLPVIKKTYAQLKKQYGDELPKGTKNLNKLFEVSPTLKKTTEDIAEKGLKEAAAALEAELQAATLPERIKLSIVMEAAYDKTEPLHREKLERFIALTPTLKVYHDKVQADKYSALDVKFKKEAADLEAALLTATPEQREATLLYLETVFENTSVLPSMREQFTKLAQYSPTFKTYHEAAKTPVADLLVTGTKVK